MTAICGGGPSEIKPLTQEIQTLGATGIVAALIGAEMDWYAFAAAGVGYITFDLLNLCAIDPPGFPEFSVDRLKSYVDPNNPNSSANLRTDVFNTLATLTWESYCQCVTGPQPTRPTPPGPPSGYQVDNPTVTAPPPGSSCGPPLGRGTTLNFDASGTAYDNFGQNYVATPFVGVTWAQVSFNLQTGAPYPVDWTLDWRATQNGPVLASEHFTQQTHDAVLGATKFTSFPPAGAAGFAIGVHGAALANASWQIAFQGTLYCSGAPTSTDQSCCPPDPTLENLIVQIMQLEQKILQQLSPSTAYTRGTRHSGLTGSGTLSVNGLFGVLVELTSGTPTTPLLPGVPPYQFSVGWVSCLTGDGMIDEIRITRQAQVWSSRLAPFATQFGYQLNDGFTADITELLPAPPAALPGLAG